MSRRPAGALVRFAAIGCAVALVAGCGNVPADEVAASPSVPAATGTPPAAPDAPSSEMQLATSASAPADTPKEYVGVMAGLAAKAPAAAKACPELRSVPLPKDPPLDQVFYCTIGNRVVPGDGEWMIVEVRRATSGVEELLDVYAQESPPMGDGPCRADLPDPLVVWLHTSPITMLRAPVDDCDKPIPAAVAAFGRLTTEVVSEERVQQIQGQTAIDTDCSQSWKDMLTVGQQDVQSDPSPANPEPLREGARVCRYDRDPKDPILGQLRSGNDLGAAQVRALNAALATVRTDPSCRGTEHTAFAVIHQGTLNELYVALDGCGVLQGRSTWRGSDELRALLK